MLLANSWQMTDLGSRNTRVSFKLYLYLLYFRETDISTGRTREFKEWEIVNRRENLVTSAILPNQRISKRNKGVIVSFWHELWFPLVAENESRET